MDKVTLLNRLEAVRRRIAASEKLIAHEKSVVERLCSAGMDTSVAQETMTTLQITQEDYLGELEEILDELDRIPPVD